MIPGIDPRKERRKKRARTAVFITVGAMIVSVLFQPGWKWVPLTVGVAVIAVYTATAMAASGDLPGGRGRGSGISGRGRDDDGPADGAVYQWRMLAMASRLMPGPAGRRWLAEAESLLSEIVPVRRGSAIRSYFLSAPLLVAMMWVREARRRARPGPRRPG